MEGINSKIQCYLICIIIVQATLILDLFLIDKNGVLICYIHEQTIWYILNVNLTSHFVYTLKKYVRLYPKFIVLIPVNFYLGTQRNQCNPASLPSKFSFYIELYNFIL